MREAVKQSLELAAENEKTKSVMFYRNTFDGNIVDYKDVIDKESIINIINQVK